MPPNAGHGFQLMYIHRREVMSGEAKRLNLVNYLVKSGGEGEDAAFQKALDIAQLLATHPQRCMQNDRLSMLNAAIESSQRQLMQTEFAYGLDTLNDSSFGSAVQAFTNKSKL